MSRYRVAVLGIAGLFGVVGCGGHGRGAARERGGISGEPAARRDGSEATTTFDLPACEAENAYSDGARIGLVDNGSAAGALLGDDRAYIMLVSEADLDVQRMADAHTGSCATYTVAYDDPLPSAARSAPNDSIYRPSSRRRTL